MAVNYGSFGKFSRISFTFIWFIEMTDNVPMNFFTSFNSFASNDIFWDFEIYYLGKNTTSFSSSCPSRFPQNWNFSSNFSVERLGRHDIFAQTVKRFFHPSCVLFWVFNIRKVLSFCLFQKDSPSIYVFVSLQVVKNCNDHFGLPSRKFVAPIFFSFERWHDTNFPLKGWNTFILLLFCFVSPSTFEGTLIFSVPSESTPQWFSWGLKWWKIVLQPWVALLLNLLLHIFLLWVLADKAFSCVAIT